jgi:hypothetical protein
MQRGDIVGIEIAIDRPVDARSRVTVPKRGGESPMKRTEEVQIVLDIVRQVLRARLDWVSQGQVLMEEILAKVERAPNRLKP